MKYFLLKINHIANQFGFDLLTMIRSLKGMPRFFVDYINFRKDYSGKINLYPCLHDRYESCGSTNTEYFWQDLLVARMIFNKKPQNHADIGSRIDGFVTHVASFMNINIFDIRPNILPIPGITYKQLDITNQEQLYSFNEIGFYDSLSCLHAIEHFGLGRYGDPIDPYGYEKGLKNMALLLKEGGYFYLSTPIGNERVEFNANYVFSPKTIIETAKKNELELIKLITITNGNVINEYTYSDIDIDYFLSKRYLLGIFIFQKQKS
ncbi:DUF268 domain-containing protein [Thiothrix unzii]|jgi:hypothetical protein|uniref:DUF268 domain-containing protein n=1 Tax=Thiothrix unzii TaxID=111769 RepID=UPI002A35D3FA|nr:DUF268 domain-containing protein [Thiothrix unzii]MDX9988225.1 DUF268 domain-containing protein [Thiothrix unzii]